MKKNILLIIPYLTDGGAERVVSELSIALAEYHNVHILLFEDKISYPFKGEKIILPSLQKNKFLFVGLLNKILLVRKLKKERNIDYSISFLITPNLINLLSRRPKEKVIVTVHTHLTEYYKRKFIIKRKFDKIKLRLLYNLADHVIAVSEGIRRDLKDNYKIKSHKLKTIYNFYNFSALTQLANTPLSHSYLKLFLKPTIINIGRLTYSKGQWNLLKAIRLVKKEVDINLIILGDGKNYKEYLNFIQDNNLSDFVFLLGFQANPYPFIKASTIFISSSKFEGLSNSIIEAMILKTPVIATDCISGPREILAPTAQTFIDSLKVEYHKNGVLLPLIHPEKINYQLNYSIQEELMAAAIVRLFKDNDLRERLSINGAIRADYFRMEGHISEWLTLIN